METDSGAGDLSETPLGTHLGVAWFRREITVPDAAAGKGATLRLGIVDDTDIAYINGSRVGATTNQRIRYANTSCRPACCCPAATSSRFA